jgi:osmotically inducible protein OsmC
LALTEGSGSVRLGSDRHELEHALTFSSRFEDGAGTNPEELIAAAHASCFSMALSHVLGQAGHPPARVHTKARVHLTKAGSGYEIPRIELQADAVVPGIDGDTFQKHAEEARRSCPVSKLVAGAEIALNAMLLETPA